MKKVTMSNLGEDHISIHFVGEQAKPLCILDKTCLRFLLSKEYDTEEHSYGQWGDYVLKFVSTGETPNWIIFKHGHLVTPLVVLNREAFLHIKEGLSLQLNRDEECYLNSIKKQWETE